MTKTANPKLIQTIQTIVAKELQTKSIESITMRYIAEKANITPTTIYYYFKSKSELVDTIKFNATAEFDSYILTSIAAINSNDRLEQITAGCRAFVEWFIQHPALADLIFEKLPPKLDMESEAMLATLYRGPLKVIELVQQGIDQGRIAPRNCTLDITIFIGMLYGVVKTWLNKRTFPEYWDDIEPLTQRMLAIIELVLKMP